MKKDSYTFVLLQNQLSCYRYIDDQWKIEPIEGEIYLQLNEDQSISWDDFLDKLNQRHNSEHKLGNVSITLIRSDESGADFINGFSKAVVNYNCTNWQILFVESLLSKKQISSLDLESIRQDLLPKTRLAEYLENIMGENEESIELKLQLQQLEQKKESLLKDIQQAKMQRTREAETVEAPSSSDLITYLPLFFADIWTKIRMSDVACFAESLEIPKISSPYQEPSNDCLHRLKRRFQQLALFKQVAILECCRDLQHHHEVRRIVLNLLGENNEK